MSCSSKQIRERSGRNRPGRGRAHEGVISDIAECGRRHLKKAAGIHPDVQHVSVRFPGACGSRTVYMMPQFLTAEEPDEDLTLGERITRPEKRAAMPETKNGAAG